LVLLKLFPDGRVEYTNCGHIQPLAVKGTQVRRLEEGNLVVGLIAEASYNVAHYMLRPGEWILLASDGVTEAEDSTGNQFGDAGLNAIAHYEDIDAIIDHVKKFEAPNLAQDDCTLLKIRYMSGM
jgi:phosphoserine phosphatase RsbU/P